MKTLTVDEIGFVSGGEAPCITLGTPCIGPPPDASDLANASAGVAVVAGIVGKVMPQADWVSKGAALLTYVLLQVDRQDVGGGGGGGGDADKKKEKEEQKLKN